MERILSAWKSAEVKKLKERMKKFDLDNTVPHPKIKPISFSEKGVWLWGQTNQGKTHISGWLMMSLIQSAIKPFVWGRVSIKDMFNTWEHIRGDFPDLKQQAYEEIMRVRRLEAVILEDVDKAGNFTPSREEEFFSMVDKFYERGVKVIVNANYSIKDFCALKLPSDAKLKQRDGMSPMERRFSIDLCDEILLAWR